MFNIFIHIFILLYTSPRPIGSVPLGTPGDHTWSHPPVSLEHVPSGTRLLKAGAPQRVALPQWPVSPPAPPSPDCLQGGPEPPLAHRMVTWEPGAAHLPGGPSSGAHRWAPDPPCAAGSGRLWLSATLAARPQEGGEVLREASSSAHIAGTQSGHIFTEHCLSCSRDQPALSPHADPTGQPPSHKTHKPPHRGFNN